MKQRNFKNRHPKRASNIHKVWFRLKVGLLQIMKVFLIDGGMKTKESGIESIGNIWSGWFLAVIAFGNIAIHLRNRYSNFICALYHVMMHFPKFLRVLCQPFQHSLGGSNGQGHKTHRGPKHGYRGIPWIYILKRRKKGKVNQLDVRNKKTNTTVVITSKNSKNNLKKKRWPTIRASDNYHCALRTSKQQ